MMTANPPDPRTECCGVDSRVGNKIVGQYILSINNCASRDAVKCELCNVGLRAGNDLISAITRKEINILRSLMNTRNVYTN